MISYLCLGLCTRKALHSGQGLHRDVASLGAEHSPDDALFVGAA
jgi:hypothetical protein